MNIQLGTNTIPFAVWEPQQKQVLDGAFAIDTETTLIDSNQPGSIPDFILGATTDGKNGYFLTPDFVLPFIQAHSSQIIAMHSASFDLKVLQKLADEQNTGIDLYDLVEQNRIYDTQLLHRLYMLATMGHTAQGKGQSTLEHCCQRYLGVKLPKDATDAQGNNIRVSWEKYRGVDPREINPVYLDYLGKDVLATFGVYTALQQKLGEVLEDNFTTWGFISHDWLAQQIARWGPQTHHIQLKGAIALERISALGIGIDMHARGQRVQELDQLINDKKAALRRRGYVPGKGSSGLLQDRIQTIQDADCTLFLARTDSGVFKTDEDALNRLAPIDSFFADLATYKTAMKLRTTYLEKMTGSRIHPSYDVLKNTGRTSSYGAINIQNLPRDNPKKAANDPRIRRCFVPAPGHVFFDCDYKTIELATLAQSVIGMGEPSRMGAAINSGEDLHRLVAAQATGKTATEVTSEERQAAKALNFGLPGGLGVKTLQAYAAVTYGVQLDEQKAQEWRSRWFDTFPEMRTFLDGGSQNTNQAIAEFFNLVPRDYYSAIGRFQYYADPEASYPHGLLAGMMVKALSSDQPMTGSGRPYSHEEISFLWSQALSCLDDLPQKLRKLLEKRVPNPQIGKLLRAYFDQAGVFTLTGRLRAGATYCARHNTLFQGLAADGAKLALWKLWRAKYRVVAFVHDQVLVEVPKNADLAAVKTDIESRMIAGMKQVVPDVKVDVDGGYRTRWTKSNVLALPMGHQADHAAEPLLAMAA